MILVIKNRVRCRVKCLPTLGRCDVASDLFCYDELIVAASFIWSVSVSTRNITSISSLLSRSMIIFSLLINPLRMYELTIFI